MRYSVYDHTRRVYDYYDAPGPSGTHAGSPPKPREVIGSDGRAKGASPASAAWRLPMGAKRVGSGELPQGRIASLSGADMLSDPTSLLVYGAIVFIAWKVLR